MTLRLSGLLACAVVLASSTAGRSQAAPNILYVAPSGSDAASCTAAAPCQSFDRAYHAAQPGTVVQVANGQYPSQTVRADGSKPPTASIANVVFEPAPGAAVQVGGEVRVEGSHVEFHSMTFGDWYAGVGSFVAETQQAAHLGFYGIHASAFYDHASFVNVVGGVYGPINNDASQVSDCDQCNYSPQHILVDGVTFHDYVRTTPGVHMECLHVYSGSFVTVRNSRFSNCAIMDLFIDNFGQSPDMHDIDVENNFFDAPGSRGGSLSSGSYSLYLGETGRTFSNVTVKNNSALSVMYVDTQQPVTNVLVSGNFGAMPQYQCLSASDGVSYDHNLWYTDYSTPARCGATDRALAGGQAAARYVSPETTDLHLEAGSPAIGSGASVTAATRDIDGDLRPLHAAADAGADQRESSEIVVGRALGEIRLGAPLASVITFYGAGAVSHTRLSRGGAQLEVHSYRVHGGRLWAAFSAGVVVGVGTSSRFYSTVGGIGVGMPLPNGLHRCGAMSVRNLGALRVAYTGASKIGSLSMVARKYLGPPVC